MKNERSYLGRNPTHSMKAIRAVLSYISIIGEDMAYEICSEILSDICGEAISVNTEDAIWDTLQELQEEGWF